MQGVTRFKQTVMATCHQINITNYLFHFWNILYPQVAENGIDDFCSIDAIVAFINQNSHHPEN